MNQPILPRWPSASTTAMLLFLSFLVATTTTDAFGIMHRHAHVAVPQQQHRSHSLSSSLLLAARGMGMGMGMASASKKDKEESTTTAGGGGMGKSSNDKKKPKKGGGPTTKNNSNNFDAKASLMRLEKRFDELQRESAKQLATDKDDEDDDEKEDPRWASDTPSSDAAAAAAAAAAENSKLFSEYIVAVRGAGAAGSSSSSSAVADWIPVANLFVSRPLTSLTFTENDDSLSATIREAAISAYCRELSYAASLGAKIFSTVARNELQYSVEPMDSFYKFVYEAVVKGSNDKKKDQEEASSMTKAQARAILDLQEGGEYDKAEIKQAYRKLSFQYHPDRLGADGVVDGASSSSSSNNSTTATATQTLAPPTTKTFALIKLAYDTLSSGIRGAQGISWYESLGGKDRMEFCGPITLLPRDGAQETLERHSVSCGLVGLDPAVVQSFVARNLRSV